VQEQHRRWSDDMPDVYDRLMVPMTFAPFASDLARRVSVNRPRRVLEVAAGTGVVTKTLVGLAGVAEVVATDLNPAMVETGRRNVPTATWEVADALALPFADAEFDTVVCQFGVMFFPDKVAGMTQARRVLAADGTFYASTWGRLDQHDVETAYMTAVRTVLPDDPPDFLTVVPHGYSDPDRFGDDARTAGFPDVTVETVTLRNGAVSARDAALGYCTGSPMRAGLEQRGDVKTLTEAIADEMERILGTGLVSLEMTAHVLIARAA
jgi:SAM-dependent methyltransferase